MKSRYKLITSALAALLLTLAFSVYGQVHKFYTPGTVWGVKQNLPADEVTYKHDTPRGFVWLTYKKDTGRVYRTAGGTYTLRGDTYAEKVEYGFGDHYEAIKNAEHTFTCKIEGDKWRHSGKLADGMSLDEEWERVKPQAAADTSDAEKELKKIQGVWALVSREEGGKKLPADEVKGVTITFAGDTFTVRKGDKLVHAGTHTLDLSKSPKTVDAPVTEGVGKGIVELGIYELDGDTLKACFDDEGKRRPTEFKTTPGSRLSLSVWKRVKK